MHFPRKCLLALCCISFGSAIHFILISVLHMRLTWVTQSRETRHQKLPRHALLGLEFVFLISQFHDLFLNYSFLCFSHKS